MLQATAASRFPGRTPGCRHPSRCAVSQLAKAVAGEEQRAEQQQPENPGASTIRFRGRPASGHPLGQDTLKMPHSSMRCSSLRETGGLHQLVHFRLAASAHHPGLALAVAGQARAISSSCGCQGWPV